MSEPNVVEPTQSADACIIWLHGLGANRFDFVPVAELLRPVLPTLRFVFPQAPTRPVTVQGGIAMPSWYDILAMSANSRSIDRAELDESARMLISLIEEQRAVGIRPERLFLAGFSQGGAVVLHTAFLRCRMALGGVLALSTYGPTFEGGLVLDETVRHIPVLHLHGDLDQVVPRGMGRAAHDFLASQGVAVQWTSYPMDHEVRPEEIGDIAVWLSERLGEARA